MSMTDHFRRILFASGLTSIALSVGLDGHFATDNVVQVPMPSTLALLAVGGVVAVAASLIRRRKK